LAVPCDEEGLVEFVDDVDDEVVVGDAVDASRYGIYSRCRVRYAIYSRWPTGEKEWAVMHATVLKMAVS
jgi:hypothetical protein